MPQDQATKKDREALAQYIESGGTLNDDERKFVSECLNRVLKNSLLDAVFGT